MSLWFKSCYVPAILAGEKTETIRAAPPRFGVGAIVSCCVGPRPPFARVEIVAIERVILDELPEPQRSRVARLYPGKRELYRIRFRLVEQLGHRSRMSSNDPPTPSSRIVRGLSSRENRSAPNDPGDGAGSG